MRHVFERNRARGTGLFTRRVIAAVATVAMLAGVGCVTASSAAAEDATGALEQQIEQPVLQESGQEDSQPVEQNLMVGEEQPSEQEQPSDQEAYQQVEQERNKKRKKRLSSGLSRRLNNNLNNNLMSSQLRCPLNRLREQIGRSRLRRTRPVPSWALRRSISASRRTMTAPIR